MLRSSRSWLVVLALLLAVVGTLCLAAEEAVSSTPAATAAAPAGEASAPADADQGEFVDYDEDDDGPDDGHDDGQDKPENPFLTEADSAQSPASSSSRGPAPPEPTLEERAAAAAWAGHLRPLGEANEKLPVQEVAAFPTVVDFFSQHVLTGKPLVVRGGATSMPALSKWSDEYLAAVPGAAETNVLADPQRKENRNRTAAEIESYPLQSFAAFVRGYLSSTQSLISDLVPALKADVTLPAALDCPLYHGAFMRALLHLNGGGARSVLHHEHYEELHCVLDGTRTVLLASPERNADLLVVDGDEPLAGEYMRVDVDAVDATKYPGLQRAVFETATLGKGDCLFLPAGWMHADSTGEGRSLSLALWFVRDDAMDEEHVRYECGAGAAGAGVTSATTPASGDGTVQDVTPGVAAGTQTGSAPAPVTPTTLASLRLHDESSVFLDEDDEAGFGRGDGRGDALDMEADALSEMLRAAEAGADPAGLEAAAALDGLSNEELADLLREEFSGVGGRGHEGEEEEEEKGEGQHAAAGKDRAAAQDASAAAAAANAAGDKPKAKDEL